MGIDSLNTNFYSSFPPVETNFSASNVGNAFPISTFDGYFANSNPYMSSFMNDDFMSTFLNNQQALMSMFSISPFGFNVGAPNFSNFKGLSAGELRQKSASMPLSKASAGKIKEISGRLNCDPKDLAAVIYAESGGNAKAVNPQTKATGLIQFMPKTAAWLGTTTQELYNMPAEKQLDYVEKYLSAMKKTAVKSGKLNPNAKINSGDLYALVFMPAKVGQNVVCSGGKALSQNKGLAKNNVITNQTLTDKVKQFWNAAEKLFK